MLFSASRLNQRRSRRALSAVVALAYLWAFVALGLTHTHPAAAVPAHHRSARVASAASPSGVITARAVASDDDGPCAVCAAAHAATAALAQRPVAALAPVAVKALAARASSGAPSRLASVLYLRGPPAA